MKEKIIAYFHQIFDGDYSSESIFKLALHIADEFEADPQTVEGWIQEENELIRSRKKFHTKSYVVGSISWLVEKRGWDARNRGLCQHCYGVGKSNSLDPFITKERKAKPCRYCRATGRDLDLEARSYEVHRERINELTLSQMIREYIQIGKKEYSIDGYQPLTTDEKRWRDELGSQMRDRFRLGSCGYRRGDFGFYNLPFYEDVLFRWSCRLHRVDQKLFRYLWEKEPESNIQVVGNLEKQLAARESYKLKVKHKANDSPKWRRRYNILFPK